jgi:hypothetical protein
LKQKRNIELIANSATLVIFAWFAYKAFFELFIFVQGVHYPRIGYSSDSSGSPFLDINFNVPTTTSIIILLSALFCIFASIMIYTIAISRSGKKTKKYWIIQAIGFSICLVSLFVTWIDFFSTAFGGVG